MPKIAVTLLCLIFLNSCLLGAGNDPAKEQVNLPESKVSKEDIQRVELGMPQFKNFPVKNYQGKLYKGKIARLKLNSHPKGREYRTALRRARDSGPNFAGELMVVTIGFGTNCQINFIVNLTNGLIIDCLSSNWGASFCKDSNLLVLDPITTGHIEIIKQDPKCRPAVSLNTRYYVWDGKKLNLIKSIDCGFEYIKSKL